MVYTGYETVPFKKGVLLDLDKGPVSFLLVINDIPLKQKYFTEYFTGEKIT